MDVPYGDTGRVPVTLANSNLMLRQNPKMANLRWDLLPLINDVCLYLFQVCYAPQAATLLLYLFLAGGRSEWGDVLCRTLH